MVPVRNVPVLAPLFRGIKMSITSAAVFDRVLNLLGVYAGSVHDIDDELLDVLLDISSRGDFLPASSASLTTTASAAAVDVSSLLVRRISHVWISGSANLVEGYKSDYLNSIALFATPTTGVPGKYFYLNNVLTLYSLIPDDAYTLQIEYYKFHAASTATIEYPDRFRKAIVLGVMASLWGGLLRSLIADKNYAKMEEDKHQADYEREIIVLKNSIPTEISGVEYKDI